MVMPLSGGICGASQSTSSSAVSSFAKNSVVVKQEKLLQVDIFPLSLPPRGAENGVDSSASTGADKAVVVAPNQQPKQRMRRNSAKSGDAADDTNGAEDTNKTDKEEERDMEEELLARQFSSATSLFDVEVPVFCTDDQTGGPPRPTAATARRRVRIDRYRDGAMPDIMRLIGRELSEPYSVYTYMYFIHQWPELCVLAIDCADEQIVGAILCKLDRHALDERDCFLSRGYIGMLAVEQSYRGHGIGTRLIRTVIELLRQQGCHEVVLETEVSNPRSLSLYGRLGFIRDARLFRYYLNGGDAFRLKLFLEQPARAPAAVPYGHGHALGHGHVDNQDDGAGHGHGHDDDDDDDDDGFQQHYHHHQHQSQKRRRHVTRDNLHTTATNTTNCYYDYDYDDAC